jgi:type III secretion system HrpB2-like protein
MTLPIDPIMLTEAAGKATAVTTALTPAQGPSIEALTQRFQALMKGPHHAENVPGADGPNVVSDVLARGEDMLRHDQVQLEQFGKELPHMSSTEALHRSAELLHSMGASQFRMHAATSLASGTNKSMQTLLKNQ